MVLSAQKACVPTVERKVQTASSKSRTMEEIASPSTISVVGIGKAFAVCEVFQDADVFESAGELVNQTPCAKCLKTLLRLGSRANE